MNRCFALRRRLCAISLLGVSALLSASSWAQTANTRQFPTNALRGKLVVQQPPEVLLDGKTDRLSPGSRIRGTDNMMVLSGTLVGQSLVVNYVRENTGLIHEVWILTTAEAAEKRATASTATTSP